MARCGCCLFTYASVFSIVRRVDAQTEGRKVVQGRELKGRGRGQSLSAVYSFSPLFFAATFWYFFGIFLGGNVCLILTVLHFIALGNCLARGGTQRGGEGFIL